MVENWLKWYRYLDCVIILLLKLFCSHWKKTVCFCSSVFSILFSYFLKDNFSFYSDRKITYLLDIVEIRTVYSVIDIESLIKDTIYMIKMKLSTKYLKKNRNCLRICDAKLEVFFLQKYKKMKAFCTETRTKDTIKFQRRIKR